MRGVRGVVVREGERSVHVQGRGCGNAAAVRALLQECAQMAAQVREAQAALEAKQQQQQQQPAAGDAQQGDEAVEAAVAVEVETKQE